MNASHQLHKPADFQSIRIAALELRGSGLTARDIAQVLGLTESAVLQLFGNSPVTLPLNQPGV